MPGITPDVLPLRKKKKEVKPGNKHKNYKTKSQPQGHLTLKSSTFSSETREASHFRVRSTPMEGASTVLKQSITHTSPVRTKAILFSKLHKHAQRNTPCTEILQSKKKSQLALSSKNCKPTQPHQHHQRARKGT